MNNKTNSNAKSNIHYALIHSLFWITYCTGTSYLSSCLLSIGFTNGQVGIVIAMCGIASAILQPTLAGVIDRSGKRLLKPVMVITVAIAILLSAVEFFIPEDMAVMALCYGFNIVALQFLIPLMNSLSVCAAGKGVNFSFGRAIGSLAFAFAAMIVGRMVTGFGMRVLYVWRIVGFVLFILCVCCFPILFSEPVTRKASKQDGFFKRNPGFFTVIIGCVFVYFCQTLTSYFGYQIIASKGGDNTSLGIALGIAAFVEVPVMLGFVFLLKYRNAAFWFVLSGFGYAVKAIAFYFAPNVPVYYAAQLAQLVGWPLMQVASVKYVSSITTDQDTTRGQAYITLTYSVALVGGSPIGGFIIQYLGVPAMLIIAAVCAIAGGAIIGLGVRRRKIAG